MDILGLKSLLLLMLVFIPLERLLPMHHGQPVLRPKWTTDLTYVFLNGLVVRVGLAVAILSIMALSSWTMPAALLAWVGSLPIWVQFPAILILSDLGFYAMHRLFHTPLLWRFHAVHHSIEHLDWLAGHRVHPVDQILTKAGSYLPVFALGFSDNAIILAATVYFWHSVLLHSNIRVNFGPLRWIVASPQFHHWHHANQPEAFDKNFAGQLSIIDVLFGTFRVPGRALPERYGVDDDMPDGYAAQLLHPFRASGATTDTASRGLEAQKG